ncbi:MULTISPECIES: alpha-N-arabinofuranosidase [unclassified Roseateles]|uniref:arabinosylfuranosidase ArfA n=1 Tax=unclassified Roseateles TaxID=2626991 RepID=UPI0006F77AE7|nr:MULTISPECIES: alpha-N-arabinofuranosidase [unclassified Roseateles]KQW46794.1 alpha-N-arabinofuranosidase [Pelomonas sp. Root405]KRA73843.1 alpha-N-arabinofuranosidase [Pelomonas sp. Root662]
MFQASLTVDRDFDIAPLDRRLFGVFVEHLGRCVYTGIYEPGHPTADEQGFRGDVAALTRELGATIVRYPGGNFMSGYNWEDGVGPKDQRPRRLDLAWYSTETNQVGTHEFMDWCRLVGMEPMFGVNLGTRGPDEARHYLEYCNHPGGTALSDLRRSHGAEAPLSVKFWCLGNEMDGPWQICQKTPDEYGRIAKETAKLMRMVDPSIELAACGSSAHDMPTYGIWEDRVLEHCYEQVDYLSLHSYFVKPPIGQAADTSTESYLAQIETNARFIRDTVAIADSVAARKRSSKRLMLSFDEWNVWYRARHGEHLKPVGWPEAPRLLEEIYTAEDALLIGGMLTMMMNHADRLKVACMAQLVNVIGPIMTEPGGPAWRQTIFHPFAQAARWARGQVLRPVVKSPGYANALHGEVPYLCASVVDDAATGQTAVFLLNRSLTDEMDLSITLRGLGNARQLVLAEQLHSADLHATNTADAPDRVAPQPLPDVLVDGEQLRVLLKPASWNVIVTRAVRS